MSSLHQRASASTLYPFPLPPSSRPAHTVLVRHPGGREPGVLVVSAEGDIRLWEGVSSALVGGGERFVAGEVSGLAEGDEVANIHEIEVRVLTSVEARDACPVSLPLADFVSHFLSPDSTSSRPPPMPSTSSPSPILPVVLSSQLPLSLGRPSPRLVPSSRGSSALRPLPLSLPLPSQGVPTSPTHLPLLSLFKRKYSRSPSGRSPASASLAGRLSYSLSRTSLDH